MKKWNLVWIIFLIACSVEHPITPDSKPEGEQEVSIQITFPGSERVKTKSPATYAIEETEENTVNTLDIFAFASGGDNVEPSDDIFMYRVTVPKSKIVDEGTTSGATKNVTTTLRCLPQKQRFVFIANLPSSISLNLTEGVTTQQAIVDQLKFEGLPWHSVQTSGNYTPIPMWGQKKDSMLISTSSTLNLGKVYLIRSMARIDIGVADGLGNFKIKNIYVYNISKSGQIAPHKSQWNEQVITKTNTLPDRVDVSAPYSFPASGNSMERTIYIPETDSLIINGTDSVKPAYLVIQAEYNNTDNYYRIDFAKDGAYHPLLRNHGYIIKIIGAKGGYQSLKEAQGAPLSDFNFSLLLEDENSDINDVIYLENQYMLGVNVSEVLFDWDKPWIGKPLTGATEYYPLSVYTTYSGGWTASLSGASWLTLEGATAGAQNASGMVKIKMTEENRTGKERKATLSVRAGMLVKEVTIRQSGGANSRMICFGSGNVALTRIPLAFANEARNGTLFNGLSTSDIEAKVLWQETGGGQAVITAKIGGDGVYTKDRHIEITAKGGAKKSGNAVVAVVRKGSGASMVGGIDDDEVLWSWHIWCMPGADYMDESYHNPNVSLFMKQMLGRYDSNKGMFYQWGRKDPFPQALTDVAPMDVANRPVEKEDNLSDAVKNPATFYHKGTKPYWTGSSPASGLWQTTKTYSDPCPAGWRVPEESEKTYWTAGTASDFSNGYLSEETGKWQPSNSSGSGFSWTLTGTGNTRNVFIPSGSGIPAVGSSDFSAGHSVRCMKDIQLIKTSL
ncbi:MAG: hypothetical protein LBJ60_00020 [Tannerellaceae bacterium]|jgi:hypothetical protein|nr:hypothetical protein [Tannerellaceae bacterium]